MDAFNKVIYNADVCVVVRGRKGGARYGVAESSPSLPAPLCQGVPLPLTQGASGPHGGKRDTGVRGAEIDRITLFLASIKPGYDKKIYI